MKKDIHPQYYPKAKVKCACGNILIIGSTKEKMGIEICSKCHPFYTGEKHLVDIAGRAEKFKARTEQAAKAAKHRKTLKKTESKTKK